MIATLASSTIAASSVPLVVTVGLDNGDGKIGTSVIATLRSEESIAEATRRLVEQWCPDLFLEPICRFFRAHSNLQQNRPRQKASDRDITIVVSYGHGIKSTFTANSDQSNVEPVTTEATIGTISYNPSSAIQHIDVTLSLKGYRVLPDHAVGSVLKRDDALQIKFNTQQREELPILCNKLAKSFADEEKCTRVDWGDRFDQLELYKAMHGDFPANPQIGRWVDTQRHQYKRLKEGKQSSMTKDRITALESLGFVWSLGRHACANWDVRLEELRAYKDTHGDCLVPHNFTANPPLGFWVRTQRYQYKLLKEGMYSNMTAERIDALEHLGFVWERLEDWEMRFEGVRCFKEKHQNCLVPERFQSDPQLGNWVMTQRKQYKLLQEGKSSSLTTERIAAMERLGFVWNISSDNWEKRLEDLRCYKENHRSCLVTNRFPTNPQLGSWVMYQRKLYKLLQEGKSSSMTEERITALEGVGFVWDY